MSAKKGLVPRLRFPEFREAGEWELSALEDLASRRTERNRDGKMVRVLTNSAEHGIVDQRDYFDKDIATQGNLENYFIVNEGDFVYNPRISAFAPVGPISRNCVAKGVMSPLYTVFRFRDPCSDFYEHYFKSSGWHLHMRQIGSTGARHDRMAVTNDDFMAMPLPFPSPEEQEKIADCISSLDALIAAQTDKLDALKTHKKGLMQQLFPRESETIPRLRFTEFWEAREWEKCRVEAMAHRGSGHTPAKKIPSYYGGGIKWVSLADSEKLDKGYIYDTKIEISEDGLKNSSAVLHPAGTVILSRDAGVGKSAVLYSPMAVSQHFMAWQCHLSDLSNWFFYYVLQKMKANFETIAVGNTIKTIGLPYFKEMIIQVPKLHEQQKIAHCLSSLDALIAAQTDKLNALKTHKKGLMQQLFPSPEAVAGCAI